MSYRPFVYGLVDPLEPGHVRYVGMAPSKASRPYEHKKIAMRNLDKSSHLYNWIRKLQNEGRDYSVLILEELSEDTTRNFLGEVEKMYIKSLNEIGHQLTNVSEGGWGGSCGPEGGAKISQAMKGRERSAEHRANLSKSIKGFTHTDEAKQKMSIASKGRKKSEETKAKMKAAALAAWSNGKYDTDEYRFKHSESVKNRSVESNQKNRDYSLGKTASEETKAKMSESQKGNTNSLGITPNEATRQKMSESAKLRWQKRNELNG